MKLNDSGKRTEFVSGAVRELGGKGRCDLLPQYSSMNALGACNEDELLVDELALSSLFDYTYSGDKSHLESAFYFLCRLLTIEESRNNSEFLGKKESPRHYVANGLLLISKQFEDGALKYAERNWERGLPLKCYIDSSIRHILKYIGGWEDEPHLLACAWNVICALETLERDKECAKDYIFSKDVMK